ncbi:MAG: NAD-dependent epimerase/dehydratase family protein [Candidatus Baltobacteraceae bacterium]
MDERAWNVVTGGAGFVGSHLVDALIERGARVLILDNLSTGRLANVEDALATGFARFVEADVACDAGSLRAAIDGAGARGVGRIWHLASPASPEAYGANPWETLAVNAVGTMSLVELALERGARFIFSSTSEIYGDPLVHPQPESYFGNVDPIGPRACYDEGKRFAEAAISVAVRARGLDAKVVRFFNCYGPRMESGDGRLIPALVDAALAGRRLPIQGTGRQTRSMTYIDDAIDLLLTVADSPVGDLRPVNVGNDDERSVEDIARVFASVADVPYDPEYLPPREGDPQRRRPELTRARALGWAPSTPLERGLRLTYEWFAAQRVPASGRG